MKPPPDRHNRHRFSAEIIGHAVWLCHVFRVSLRNVELLLADCPLQSPMRRCRHLLQEIWCEFRRRPVPLPATARRQVGHRGRPPPSPFFRDYVGFAD